jgi:hypothetical protein
MLLVSIARRMAFDAHQRLRCAELVRDDGGPEPEQMPKFCTR